MKILLRNSCTAVLMLLCAILAACTQNSSSVSTYNGDLSTSVADQRKANRSTAKLKKAKTKRIKKATAAFVGGRNRGIVRNAPWKCVPGRLKTVINQISKKYGKVIINSTHRSSKRNRRAGGKKSSYHLRCQAVDFRVQGNTRGLTRWLSRNPLVGGYKRYPAGYYHIDTGPRRTW